MEKKKYSTPAVSVMALQQQDMLCGSPGSMVSTTNTRMRSS